MIAWVGCACVYVPASSHTHTHTPTPSPWVTVGRKVSPRGQVKLIRHSLLTERPLVGLSNSGPAALPATDNVWIIAFASNAKIAASSCHYHVVDTAGG